MHLVHGFLIKEISWRVRLRVFCLELMLLYDVSQPIGGWICRGDPYLWFGQSEPWVDIPTPLCTALLFLCTVIWQRFSSCLKHAPSLKCPMSGWLTIRLICRGPFISVMFKSPVYRTRLIFKCARQFLKGLTFSSWDCALSLGIGSVRERRIIVFQNALTQELWIWLDGEKGTLYDTRRGGSP